MDVRIKDFVRIRKPEGDYSQHELNVTIISMTLMTTTHHAFHRGAAAFFSLLTPEQTRQIAALEADPDLVERLEELSAKANDGELNESERAEYEAYIEANNFLAVLQAEARYCLRSDGA